MTDWAAWGATVGTQALAGATFATVRSSSRPARIAERALMAGQPPLLTPAQAGLPEGNDEWRPEVARRWSVPEP